AHILSISIKFSRRFLWKYPLSFSLFINGTYTIPKSLIFRSVQNLVFYVIYEPKIFPGKSWFDLKLFCGGPKLSFRSFRVCWSCSDQTEHIAGYLCYFEWF